MGNVPTSVSDDNFKSSPAEIFNVLPRFLKQFTSYELHSIESTPVDFQCTVDGRYVIKSKLGEGGFGAVYLVEDVLDNKKEYALKLMKYDAKNLEDYKQEASVHGSLQHENIVKIYKSFLLETPPLILGKDPQWCILLEYCQGNTLDKMVDVLSQTNINVLPLDVLVPWVLSLIDAISYCHEQKIIHRDLKLDNVLTCFNANIKGESLDLLIDLKLKIADFGLSRFLKMNELAKTQAGTLLYSSPEQVIGKDYDGKVDIWALGVIFMQLATLCTTEKFLLLFQAYINARMQNTSVLGSNISPMQLIQLTIVDPLFHQFLIQMVPYASLSTILEQIICLREKRLTAAQLYAHPIIQLWKWFHETRNAIVSSDDLPIVSGNVEQNILGILSGFSFDNLRVNFNALTLLYREVVVKKNHENALHTAASGCAGLCNLLTCIVGNSQLESISAIFVTKILEIFTVILSNAAIPTHMHALVLDNLMLSDVLTKLNKLTAKPNCLPSFLACACLHPQIAHFVATSPELYDDLIANAKKHDILAKQAINFVLPAMLDAESSPTLFWKKVHSLPTELAVAVLSNVPPKSQGKIALDAVKYLNTANGMTVQTQALVAMHKFVINRSELAHSYSTLVNVHPTSIVANIGYQTTYYKVGSLDGVCCYHCAWTKFSENRLQRVYAPQGLICNECATATSDSVSQAPHTLSVSTVSSPINWVMHKSSSNVSITKNKVSVLGPGNFTVVGATPLVKSSYVGDNTIGYFEVVTSCFKSNEVSIGITSNKNYDGVPGVHPKSIAFHMIDGKARLNLGSKAMQFYIGPVGKTGTVLGCGVIEDGRVFFTVDGEFLPIINEVKLDGSECYPLIGLEGVDTGVTVMFNNFVTKFGKVNFGGTVNKEAMAFAKQNQVKHKLQSINTTVPHLQRQIKAFVADLSK